MASSPPPPQGCTTAAALEKRHAGDRAFLESKIISMGRPRLGARPSPAAQLELAAAALREEMQRKHEAERAALVVFLAAAPPEAIASSSAVAATVEADTAKSDASTATGGGGAGQSQDASAADAAADVAGSGAAKKTKAQRRREKKGVAAATAAEPSDDEDGAPAKSAVSKKEAETAALSAKLHPLGFEIVPVAADGNCLFRAAADQLSRIRAAANMGAAASTGGGEGAAATAAGAAAADSVLEHVALRRRAADYIRLHADDFAPFLPYEKGDAYPEGGGGGGGGVALPLSHAAAVRAAVERYTTRLATTSAWGGHPEIRALACTLGIPFLVFQAEGDPWKLSPAEDAMDRAPAAGGRSGRWRGGEEAVIRLSYHRHYYALGEHYNSVRPRDAAVRVVR